MNATPEKIIVTGGAGFIGSHLCEALLTGGAEIVVTDPRRYCSTNVDGTLNLLEGCRKSGVKHFVFASFSSVYGVNKKVPVRRARPSKPEFE